ncbi:MAG: hypothetical protein ABI992_02400, partial [Chthoniobacterales bacterium]
MSDSKKTATSARVVAVVVCLALALAGALLVRHFDAARSQSAKAKPQAAASSPEQILAQIPDPNGDSQTDKAIIQARAKVKQNPRNPLGWVMLGDSLMQKARDATDETYYDPAELAYGYALQLDPRFVGAMDGMAWVKGDRHLFDESIDWGKKAIAIDPGNAAAYGIIGDAALQLGDYDQAYADYQKMTDLRPDVSSYSRGAYLLWVTGKRQDSFWLMEKAIRAGAPYA